MLSTLSFDVYSDRYHTLYGYGSEQEKFITFRGPLGRGVTAEKREALQYLPPAFVFKKRKIRNR
jgi:hypothetical protein